MSAEAVATDATRVTPNGSPVIELRGVSKAYKIFGSKLDNLADALGLDRVLPWYRPKRQEFWALRDIDLELGKGERIGIVGRNGAGKTTLLKLITRNLSPTTGSVAVNGKVQALMTTGSGFHPDFTGRDNIKAALTLQGFGPREIAASIDDIEDFTELGEFLDRPFKTYSSGMMARLMFATATAIRPEILIIDEILGAGDAYFLGKSNERMRSLVDSGASILLVSHSMEQITLICSQAIWLDRGRVVKRGPSLDVVSAYMQYLRQMEDRRKRARNQKVASGRRLPNDVLDSYAETVLVQFGVPPGARLEVSGVRLLHDGAIEEECRVGDAQDSLATAPAFVVLTTGAWERPAVFERTPYRALGGGQGEVVGQVAINLFALYPKVRYTVEVEYRLPVGSATLDVWLSGKRLESTALAPTDSEFTIATIDLPTTTVTAAGPLSPPAGPIDDAKGRVVEPFDRDDRQQAASAHKPQTRWPGEGSLLIQRVELSGEDGRERAVFEHGGRMTLRMRIVAAKSGTYPVIPVAVLYRADGVKVFAHIGSASSLTVEARDEHIFELDLGPLNLGNGQYAFALAIYRHLDAIGVSVWYDLIDRDYRFEVVDAPPFMGLVDHEGHWTVD